MGSSLVDCPTFLTVLAGIPNIHLPVSEPSSDGFIPVTRSEAVDWARQARITAVSEAKESNFTTAERMIKLIRRTALSGGHSSGQSCDVKLSVESVLSSPNQATPQGAWAESILAPEPEKLMMPSDLGSPLGPLTPDIAAAALLLAPMMIDLQSHLCWSHVFESRLGTLSQFLARGEASAALALGEFAALRCDDGRILRVAGPTRATPICLSKAMARGDSRLAAAVLAGSVIAAGGIDKTPVVALRAAISRTVKSGSSVAAAARSLVDMLGHLPTRLVLGLSRRNVFEAIFSDENNFSVEVAAAATAAGVRGSNAFLCGIEKGHTGLIQSATICRRLKPADTAGSEATRKSVSKKTVGGKRSRNSLNEGRSTGTGQGAPKSTLTRSAKQKRQRLVKPINVKPINVKPIRAVDWKAVLADISKSEFGMGDSDSNSAVAKSQRARLGRALKRLSSELYSASTHFALELLQNADDNSYGPGVEPSAILVLEPTRVSWINNELGFTEADLRSICDIGRSTKVAEKLNIKNARIGRKGIGFKAVFRVSDTPEVHSRDLHIGFDACASPLGLVLPRWLGPGSPRASAIQVAHVADRAAANVGADNIAADTFIVLPLRQRMPRASRDKLLNACASISPASLLFLRRLCRVRIVTTHASPARFVDMKVRRPENGVGIATIHVFDAIFSNEMDGGGRAQQTRSARKTEHKWLQYTETDDSPPGAQGAYAERTAGFRELSLAFLLDDKMTTYIHQNQSEQSDELKATQKPGRDSDLFTTTSPTRPAPQPVFAFLPVRSYGFRFIVQGDFVVPSSRESLDQDSEWNAWLSGRVPRTFTNAFQQFRELARGDRAAEVRAAVAYLSFAPVQGETEGLFAGTASAIAARLQNIECIPTQMGGWATPPRAVLTTNLDDHTLYKALPPPRLLKLLRLEYAARGVRIRPALCRALRMRAVSMSLLARFGEAIVDDSEGIPSGREGSEWCANYLLCVHACLELEEKAGSGSVAAESLSHIARLPIIQIGDAPSHSPRDCFAAIIDGNQPLFLPPRALALAGVDETGGDGGLSTACIGRCVSLRIFDGLSAAKRAALWRTLLRLGARASTPAEILNSMILPAFEAGAQSGLTELQAVNYAVFLKANWGSISKKSEVADRVRQWVVAAAQGSGRLVRPFDQAVYFPAEYLTDEESSRSAGAVRGLASLLTVSKIPFALLSTTYVSRGGTAAEWRDFWSDMGVCLALRVEQEHRHSRGKDRVAWTSPHFSALVDSARKCKPDIAVNRMRQLAVCVFSDWDRAYEPYCSSSETEGSDEKDDSKTRVMTIGLEQVFATATWMPGSDGKLHRPCDLWLSTPLSTELFGKRATYADVPDSIVKYSTMCAQRLGLRTQVCRESAAAQLRRWANAAKGKTFRSSVAEILKLYRFIAGDDADNGPPPSVPVFVPDAPVAVSTKSVPGSFYEVRDLRWADESGALDALSVGPRVLKNYFDEEHKSLFVYSFGVSLEPFLADYINALKHLASTRTASSAELPISSIICAIAQSRVPAAKARAAVRSAGSVLVSVRGAYIGLDSDPVYVDEAQDIPNPSALPPMLMQPKEFDKSRFREAMEYLSVPRLSSRVRRVVEARGNAPRRITQLATGLVSQSLRVAQAYTWTRWSQSEYDSAAARIASGVSVRAALSVRFMPFLQRYPLQEQWNTTEAVWSDGCLYVQFAEPNADVKSLPPRVRNAMLKELTRAVTGGSVDRSLASVLQLAASAASVQELQDLLSDQDLKRLPDTAALWTMGNSGAGDGPSVSREGRSTSPVKGGSESKSDGANEPDRLRATLRALGKPTWGDLAELQARVTGAQSTASNMNSNAHDDGFVDPELLATVRATALRESGANIPVYATERAVPTGGASEDTGTPGGGNAGADAWSLRDTGVREESISLDSESQASRSLHGAARVSAEALRQTGDWGERFVFEWLRQRHPRSTVVWVNQEGETGKPYDITIRDATGRVVYVEVKATRRANLDVFPISWAELLFAAEHSRNFRICRVYNAGGQGRSARVITVASPVTRLVNKQAKLLFALERRA